MEKVHVVSDSQSLLRLGWSREAAMKHGTMRYAAPNCCGMCRAPKASFLAS